MRDERKVSWFGLLLRLVFVVFIVSCVSVVLGEAGRGQSVCHLTHLQLIWEESASLPSPWSPLCLLPDYYQQL